LKTERFIKQGEFQKEDFFGILQYCYSPKFVDELIEFGVLEYVGDGSKFSPALQVSEKLRVLQRIFGISLTEILKDRGRQPLFGVNL
jgi:hypothetical protein